MFRDWIPCLLLTYSVPTPIHFVFSMHYTNSSEDNHGSSATPTSTPKNTTRVHLRSARKKKTTKHNGQWGTAVCFFFSLLVWFFGIGFLYDALAVLEHTL